jgi:hypothetical protein
MVFGLFFFGTAAGSGDGAVRRGRMGFSSRLIQGQGKTDQGAVLRVRLTRIVLRQGPRSVSRRLTEPPIALAGMQQPVGPFIARFGPAHLWAHRTSANLRRSHRPTQPG